MGTEVGATPAPTLRTNGPDVETNHVLEQSFARVCSTFASASEKPLRNHHQTGTVNLHADRQIRNKPDAPDIVSLFGKTMNKPRTSRDALQPTIMRCQACSPCTDNCSTSHHTASKMSRVSLFLAISQTPKPICAKNCRRSTEARCARACKLHLM